MNPSIKPNGRFGAIATCRNFEDFHVSAFSTHTIIFCLNHIWMLFCFAVHPVLDLMSTKMNEPIIYFFVIINKRQTPKNVLTVAKRWYASQFISGESLKLFTFCSSLIVLSKFSTVTSKGMVRVLNRVFKVGSCSGQTTTSAGLSFIGGVKKSKVFVK